jgi:hypothetical protein
LPSRRFALALTVAALGPDLAAQAIEIGIRPTPENASTFLLLHRMAVLLSGYVANGLYSLTALLLAWWARHVYPPWLTGVGIAVAVFGFALSVA